MLQSQNDNINQPGPGRRYHAEIKAFRGQKKHMSGIQPRNKTVQRSSLILISHSIVVLGFASFEDPFSQPVSVNLFKNNSKYSDFDSLSPVLFNLCLCLGGGICLR